MPYTERETVLWDFMMEYVPGCPSITARFVTSWPAYAAQLSELARDLDLDARSDLYTDHPDRDEERRLEEEALARLRWLR